MRTTTIARKLAFVFAGLLVLLFFITGIAISKLAQVNEDMESFVNGRNARLLVTHELREAIDLRAIAARNLVLVTKPEDLAVEKQVVERAHAAATASMAKLGSDGRSKATYS